MSPDLNSLSPSNPSSIPSQQHNNPTSDSPPQIMSSSLNSSSDMGSRRPSRSSPRAGRSSVSERRRSGLNLNLNESAVGDFPPSDHRSVHAFRTASPTSIGGSPIIGTGDPHHHRAPSLGELHQELEQEQEAQVNRLLQMIRSQQAQLQQLQQQHAQSQQQPSSTSGTAVVDDSTPSSERSASFPPIPPLPAGNRTSAQLSSSLSSRRPSRPSSQAASPSLRPTHGAESRGEGLEWITAANESPVRRSSRDESSFYQAEASMLGRENQMLRQRIRDLERQINDLTTGQSSVSGSTPMQSARSSEAESSGQPGPAVEKS